MLRNLPAIASALVLTLLVAGCGSVDRAEYERELAAVGRIVDRSLQELPQDESTTVGPAEVRRVAQDLREAADRLEDLDPPADAREAQDRLERGLRGVAAAFEQLATDLAEVDSDSAQAELFVKFASDEDVDAAFEDIVGAQEAYAEDGYRVFARRPAAK